MYAKILVSTLCLSLFAAPLALAQQPSTSQGKADQAKTEAKTKKKYTAEDDFGTLHDKAKRNGVDTSNPESLKGRSISGEIAKKTKL
jgi:hypothetical protein